jgi:hypothetical protein
VAMTVDLIPDIDGVLSSDREVRADASTERPAFAAVVVPIKQPFPPESASLSHERLHQIDRVFFGPFFREKYGRGGDKALENDRIRYYGPIQPADDGGELAGRRYVHEFDTMTGYTRGWHEMVDRAGNIRQVRPERNDGIARHYQFDGNGRYRGSW